MLRLEILIGKRDLQMVKYSVFLEVLRQKSFTKAGDILGYSQSSVSQIIAQLEKEFGTKLLSRSNHNLEITPDGEQLLPYINDICNTYNSLQRKAASLDSTKGLVRIGTFQSMTCTYLPRLFDELYKKSPGVVIDIMQSGTYESVEAAILNDSVDFGFVIGERIHSLNIKMEIIELKMDPLFAVLNSSSIYADKPSFSIEYLRDCPFLLVDEGKFNLTMQKLNHLGVTPNVKLTTHDGQAIMAMVEKNLGVTILPKLVVDRNIYKVKIKPLDPVMTRRLCIGYKSYSSLSKTSKTCISILTELLM